MSVEVGPIKGEHAAVIVCSTRAAAGEYEDKTGPVIAEALREWGFDVSAPHVVSDGEAVEAALRSALDGGARLILTTGGTGITSSDFTPEMTAKVIGREIPGIAEALRADGVAKGVPTAVLSRGIAGVARGSAGAALVVNLPGSRGGVRDGLAVLEAVVPHAVSQVQDGDH